MQVTRGGAPAAFRNPATTSTEKRMEPADRSDTWPRERASFLIGIAAGLTIAMLLFPPFISVSGTEYAFIASGPAWTQHVLRLGVEPGLSARIHWAVLGAQLGAVWALAGLASWLLGRSGRRAGRA